MLRRLADRSIRLDLLNVE